MRRLRIIFLVLAAAALTGCGQKKRGFTLAELMTKLKGPNERQLVAQMFESDDPDCRRAAMETLARKSRFRREPYLKGYAALADDPDATVRSAALRILGVSGDAKYVKTIAAALGDKDRTVRRDAAVALNSLCGAEAIRPLAGAALNDPDKDVRAAAVRALRHYRRADVVETLLRCLDDRDFGVRYRAGESLRELTGLDGGSDPDRWREVLRDRKDLFAPASRPRPWWDWFGFTRKGKDRP